MYKKRKKSLILFFTITCVNTSFGNSNTTDSKNQFVPVSFLDVELLKRLENVEPAQAIHYLTLQQELNQNHMNERTNNTSKPGLFCLTATASAFGLIVASCALEKSAQRHVIIFFGTGLVGSLMGMGFTSNTNLYTDKNTDILKKMESIHLTPTKK